MHAVRLTQSRARRVFWLTLTCINTTINEPFVTARAKCPPAPPSPKQIQSHFSRDRLCWVMLQLHCATVNKPSCTPPSSITHTHTHTQASATLLPTQIEPVWGLFFFPLSLKEWKLPILWSLRIANSFSNAKGALHHYNWCCSSHADSCKTITCQRSHNLQLRAAH